MERPDRISLRERALRLGRVTAELSSALSAAAAAELVLDAGTEMLGAAQSGLWMLSEDGVLVAVATRNWEAEAVARIPVDADRPLAESVRRAEPLWIASREDFATRYPTSEEKTRTITPEIFSFGCLPLVTQGRAFGALAFVFDTPEGLAADDRAFAELLAQHCAHAVERARLYAAEQLARREAEDAAARASFLADATRLLSESLDYETTLRNVARAAVPRIADWCGVEMVQPSGESVQVTVAHVDPSKVRFARELRERYPPDPAAPTGVFHVIRTGRSELYPEIPEEMLVAGARDAEHLRIIRELGVRSAMIVAIRAGDEIVGALSFVSAESGRRFTQADLQMAELLADRAGVAISNARLFAEHTAAVAVRDAFLSIAGHELRTPLTALMLQAETIVKLAGQLEDGKLEQRAVKLLAQARRMSRLVSELLDISRITGGRLRLDLEEMDLVVEVIDVAASMTAQIRRAGCDLQIERPEQAVAGRWDRVRVHQIVSNLLSNAIKYGAGKPVAVRVRADDDEATIEVVDRGIGISAADQTRIFERFERAVSSRHYGGFGLGLWIVRQIAEAHGGSIEVESTPGQGATFRVVLPRWTAGERDAEARTTPLPA